MPPPTSGKSRAGNNNAGKYSPATVATVGTVVVFVVAVVLTLRMLRFSTSSSKEPVDYAAADAKVPKEVLQRKAEFPDAKDIQRLDFMYSKGVMSWESPVTRKDKFGLLLNPPANSTYVKALERLDTLLEPGGDRTSDTVPDDVQKFADAMTAMPQWNDAKSAFVHPSVKEFLVQRVQRGGLCYLNAPIVVQHYLVSMHQKKMAGMIDMAAMIRNTWVGEQLTQHIFDAKGGYSREMLQHILQPESVITAVGPHDYEAYLKQFGPALVTTFAVHVDFANNTKQGRFDGKLDRKTKLGLHAMVLVGARTDARRKRWFLLQNWWPTMQFVEVSETYLESAGATVYFVKTPQPTIPKKFPQHKTNYAENENFDKEETFGMGEG